jgi:cyclic beta-1,2-glucan synthetase
LLADGIDADTEKLESDIHLLRVAAKAIAELNRRYHLAGGDPRFLLLHRRRIFNASENTWMGWERKRGKLHELNRLLRGATDTSFVATTDPDSGLAITATTVPADVRYVITLDADTRLPRDAALQLIGKMAHPLNKPRFCQVKQRVIEGYAILQPRVTPSLPVGREGSFYQRVFSSPGGIDPYAAALSDVYQDLFGEGSFTGKGIYDVDAFEAALALRVPDNTLLSHDLFEGVFARAGLASDVEVVEDFPSRYEVIAKRQHRWTRGDWQLLPWICGRFFGRVAVPPIGRWKMLDNLRRSLVAPFTFIALGLCWLLPSPYSALGVLLVLTSIAIPTFLFCFSSLLSHRKGVRLGNHLSALLADLRLATTQFLLIVVFLPDQAWRMVDAVGRTLQRLFVTRRHLLEWTTAARSQQSPRLSMQGFYRQMAIGTTVAAVMSIAAITLAAAQVPRVSALKSSSDFVVVQWSSILPLLALWLAAPALALYTSRSSRVARRTQATDTQANYFRLTARRTWRYFETFVTAEDNMLPPDNFQEDPEPVVAHRTSPTNIGLYLLSAVAARDFGWAGTVDIVGKIEACFNTLQKLPLCNGHFFNWYGTRDLRPLEPAYVSSVDSGNLASHLIVLANACDEWRNTPFSPDLRLGLMDNVRLARTANNVLAVISGEHGQQLAALLNDVETKLSSAQAIETLLPVLRRLAEKASKTALCILPTIANDNATDLTFWVQALQRSVTELERDRLESVDGWLGMQTRLTALAVKARAWAMGMDFAFLLDPERKLLSIGYSHTNNTLDSSCYDLLASEARLASLFAIAKGDVATRHWFRLGRAATPIGTGSALISWSGSMFEYLMPSLVMRAPMGSLLEQTNRLVVKRQQAYGNALGLPWGISESAYNARDIEFTYQYSNFGVPGLGLKRGLAENIVVAPYATGLATMVDPHAAHKNYEHLADLGALGRYGFFEAIDFTRTRLPDKAKQVIVRNFMAHHQAMTIVAIANTLHAGQMRARFHREPMIQASELLLQERLPRNVVVSHPRAEEVKTAARQANTATPSVRRIWPVPTLAPEIHLLSNGRYTVMLTAVGAGYSRWRDIAITRWREDVTCDEWGSFIFLRDVDSGHCWSTCLQPLGNLVHNTSTQTNNANVTLSKQDRSQYESLQHENSQNSRFQQQTAQQHAAQQEKVQREKAQQKNAQYGAVLFGEDHAEFSVKVERLTATMNVLVSGEDDGEVRRITLTNSGRNTRHIELTSYAELVLTKAAADDAHPAFAKLFVVTEYLPEFAALIATRRVRGREEGQVWAAHFAVVDDESVDTSMQAQQQSIYNNPNQIISSQHNSDPDIAEENSLENNKVENTFQDYFSAEPQYETDRAKFLGRNRTIANAAALFGKSAIPAMLNDVLHNTNPTQLPYKHTSPSSLSNSSVSNSSVSNFSLSNFSLSNTVGTVLDPIFSLRHRVRITPGKTVRVAFWTVVATSRGELLDLIDKHHDRSAFDRTKTLAWTQAQVQLRHLDVETAEAADFQRLAAPILYADVRFRAPVSAIIRGAGVQSGLWPHGISGDLPIVLLRIDNIEDIAQVRQLLRAHEYWRMKFLAVDLVIINEHASSYMQELQIAIDTVLRSSQSRSRVGEELARGSVYALRADLMTLTARELLQSVARVVLVARRGTVAEQLARLPPPANLAAFDRYRPIVSKPEATVAIKDKALEVLKARLEFFNGLGGFDKKGREYVTILNLGQSTPAPWINVIANSRFGFQVAAEGSGYSWAENSRENQLTPWSNDPVCDGSGESLYIRDEDSFELWSPTAYPIRDQGTYITRHGFGYSSFEHRAQGIESELQQFVPLNDPIKISRLRLHNVSSRPRRLTITAYAEWVLGTARGTTAPFITTETDSVTGALLARNTWSTAFPGRVGFADLAGQQTSWTADRTEFLGRNGSRAAPISLRGNLAVLGAPIIPAPPLSGAVGAGLDPCAALQAVVEIGIDETVEVLWFLGQCGSVKKVQVLIARYRNLNLDDVLTQVKEYWQQTLGAVQVQTPERAMDIMLNGWLQYQTLACRIWARSGFYQASGAYGFRDQLQDGMALTFSNPAETRRHILRAAGRQFPEGDVQHWWLPQSGQGVRTRISDDRVWLAFATATYIVTSGDTTILDETVSFLEGPLLHAGEHDAFFQPMVADESASLFEHCARGIDQCLRLTGELGLPLMGTGDWNDGMNRVGENGKGESVWLGWLVLRAIELFAPFAEARQLSETNLESKTEDIGRAQGWRAHARNLKEALENKTWDGEWYRRATFDDGTWLGSKDCDECKIDSIAQTWAVLSGSADPVRAQSAMASLEKHLIQADDNLALLFTPPFEKTLRDPGYIKGYPPGLRENGGQYSHAAMWAVFAFAKLQQGDKAVDLFNLLNPINRTLTATAIECYKVEPYVVAADVYSCAPHVGRGGWTWYTGAAGWMYRAGVEGILGIRREGKSIIIEPSIPSDWPEFSVAINVDETQYDIRVVRRATTNDREKKLNIFMCDGVVMPTGKLVLDGGKHLAVLTINE